MSRTRRILGGATVGYIHQAAIVVVGLWLTPFLLHRIGQRDYGLWLVVGQLLGYLALLDIGVLAILPREVAARSARLDDPSSDLATLVSQVRRILRWQLPLLAIACVVVWMLLPADWIALRWPLTVVFVAFIGLYPLRIVSAVLQGLQELAFLAKLQMVGWAIGTCVTLALVIVGSGLYALVVGWTVTVGVPAVAAWWRLRHQRPGVLRAQHDVPPVATYLHRSIWVSVGQIAQVLLAGSDVLILGRMLGPAAVVPYACTGKLVTVFANHPQLLMQAAQPALTELRASESRQRVSTVATALTQAMLMMSGALLVVIVVVNHSFVDWWVGPMQYGGWWLSVAFAGMMLLRHWNVACVYTLFCFGHERQLSITSLVDGVVTITATVLCVSKWGAIGAPIGSIAGVVVVSLPINVWSVAREMRVGITAFLRSISPLFLGVAAIGSSAAIASRWLGPSPAWTAVVLVPSAALYAAMVFAIAWNGPVGPYIRFALPRIRPRSQSTERLLQSLDLGHG